MMNSPPMNTNNHADSVPTAFDISPYHERVRGLPGIATLQQKTVVLVGLGSVGSDLGAKLVRIGVRVLGCDPDVLAEENLIRWGLPAIVDRSLGQRKAKVWQDILLQTVPRARCEGHDLDIVRKTTLFDRLLQTMRPDLLIAATDTRDSRGVVNAMAARHDVPALFVALSDGAASVRIEVVENARLGPCHYCAMHAEGSTSSEHARASHTPYMSKTNSEPVAVPALPVDIALGTAIATRIAMSMLAGEEWRAFMKNGAQRGNVLFVSMRPDHWIFDGAYDRFVYEVDRYPDCPTCGPRDEVHHE